MNVPAALPVMLTVTVHEPLAAMVPPVRLTVVDPPVAVTVPLVHVVLALGVDETIKPVGSVSLTAMPVKPVLFGLVIFNVRTVLPFRGIEFAPKVFKSTGGETTVRFADDELPVPPSLEVTGPAVLV